MEREKVIIRTSVIGIIANVLLAGFKAIIGLMANSISIVLDAVNNLSDALSSVITIVGTKLARKAPDKKHPLGYGRIEYITAVIISVIVLYAGVTSLSESIKKIIHPEKADYSAASLIIVAAAVVVKLLLGRYVKATGERVNSGSLIASGEDAKLDSIISASTLAAAIIFIVSGVSLEAYLGAVISVIIIKSGVEMLRDTLSQILGERVESSLSKEIKMTVSSFEGVQGAYDLLLHNYGPDMLVGSVHIEIPDTWTAHQIDDLTRQIQHKVYRDYHVILATVGIYSMNTKDDFAMKVRTDITELVMSHDHVLQMHGFYLDEEDKRISFDMIIDFAADDRKEIYRHVVDELAKMYPDYQIQVAMDVDVSD
ncbi:MAG: cation transporter [Eubacterium sp.]|nr:cation transporter [Eubacterium sp.]